MNPIKRIAEIAHAKQLKKNEYKEHPEKFFEEHPKEWLLNNMGIFEKYDFSTVAAYQQMLEQNPQNSLFAYRLGGLYALGKGVARNDKKALYYFHLAEKNGMESANPLFLYCLKTYLTKAMPEGPQWVFDVLYNSADTIAPGENDEENAYAWLSALSAYCKKENEFEDAALFQRAAEFGRIMKNWRRVPDPEIERQVNSLLEQDTLLTRADNAYKQGDYAQAFEMYGRLACAEGGNHTAEYALGIMYAEGTAPEQSYGAAACWFDMASRDRYLVERKGAADRCRECIRFYVNEFIETNTPKELIEEFRDLDVSMTQGAVRLYSEIYNMAEVYFLDQAYAKAEKLFRICAEYNGDSDAQYYLATLYAGTGVHKSITAALYWYDLAAEKCRDVALAAAGGTELAEEAKNERDRLLKKCFEESSKDAFYKIIEQLAEDCTNGTEDIPQDSKKAAYWRKLRDEMLSGNKETAPAEKPAKREYTNGELNRAAVTHCAGLLGTPEWPKYTAFVISGTENLGRLKLDEYKPENTWSLQVSVKHRDRDRQFSNFVWFDDREVIIEKLHTQEGVEEILEYVNQLSQQVDEYWAEH